VALGQNVYFVYFFIGFYAGKGVFADMHKVKKSTYNQSPAICWMLRYTFFSCLSNQCYGKGNERTM